MSIGASKPRNRKSPDENIIGFGDYIDLQLAKVRTYVRISDLAVAVTTGITLVAALIFLAILVDHWIMDLGRIGRFSVLASAFGILTYVFFARVLPLLAKRLNPAYVANVIETNEPSLNNSLLNFVLFRSQPKRVRKVVMDAVERQAATDLARVDVDATIDHTPIIRIGAALGTLMFAFALYAFFSPKDPLQSVARILVPWNDRARPSRVEILRVEPGTTTVYSGRQLDVTASIHHLRDDENAAILFSSADGQAIDSRVAMQLIEPSTSAFGRSAQDGQWQAAIPASGDGLHQDITYKVLAGDAVAGPYRVKVLPSPSIVVDKIEYDYPAYMNREPLVASSAGEINSVEGTRVTVYASANQPIEAAYIEFDADQSIKNTTRKTVPMKHADRDAWASFTLKMKADRKTPWHSSYQVRFRNLEQAANDRPAQYGIQVTPDLAPVVEILTPSKRVLALPVNGSQVIEIRALDPDYGLETISLNATVRGSKRSLDKILLEQDPNSRAILGQHVVKFRFSPRQLRLQPGDIVDYQAIAQDNRIDPSTGKSDPNVSKTEAYRFEITVPDPNANDQPHRNDPDERGNAGQNGDNQDGAADEKQQNNQEGNNQDGNTKQQQDGDQQDGGQQDNGEEKSGEEKSGEEKSGEENGGQPGGQPGEPDSSQPNDDNQPSDASNDPDGQSDQQNGQHADRDGQDSPDGKRGQQEGGPKDSSNQGNQPTGENQDAADPNGQPSQNDGSRGENSDGKRTPDGSDPDERPDGSTTDDSSTDDQEPLPSDGSRDGDAMERILEKIRKESGKEPKGNNDNQPSEKQSCENCNDGTCQNCRNAANETGQKGNQSDRKNGDPADSKSNSGDASPDNPKQSDNGNHSPNGGQDPNEQNQNNRRPSKQDGQPDESKPAESKTDESKTGEPKSGEPKTGETGKDKTGNSQDPKENTSSENTSSENDGQSQEADDRRSENDSNSDQNPNSQDPKSQNNQGDSQQANPKNNGENSNPKGENPNPRGENSERGKDAGDPSKNQQAPSQQDPAGNKSNAESPTTGDGSDPSAGNAEGDGQDDKQSDIEAEDANLDYAREATDLVLDYLKNQQNRRDPELLDELGWTPEQLAEFTRRWNQLKQDARRNDPVGVSARGELDEVLRSLGLTPASDRKRRARTTRDNLQSGNSGRRTKAPAIYRQRYERFLKSNRGAR